MRSKMCKFVELHITPMLWQVLMLALFVCALHVDVKDLLPALDTPAHTEAAIEEADGFTVTELSINEHSVNGQQDVVYDKDLYFHVQVVVEK
ncbi:MAG: hypothetical protein J6Z06_04400, partial [Lachnospiraceae bacterium]|nr:hypothetical protein [Lachnospiraceae bacterium]